MKSSSSTTEPHDSSAAERVLVGLVRRPHGVRGELAVDLLSDVPGRFEPGATLAFSTPTGAHGEVTIVAVRSVPQGLLVQFAGIDDRAAADELRGARLEVPRDAVPAAPEGSYYEFELLGYRAVDARAGDLGNVIELADAGAGLLLVVALADGRRVALPFVDEFVVAVDRAERRIDWRLPEGLIEACAFKS